MFEDLVKTVKAQLYDRITSPLLGCFALSWAAWNYKLLFTLFSGMNVKDKFNYIDTSLYESTYKYLSCGLIFPLATTAFFIFVYPYPAKVAYSFVRNRQAELKEIQQKIDDETPLTREEAKKIRSDAVKMSIEFEQEIEKLREENLTLRNVIKEFNGNEQTKTPTLTKDENSNEKSNIRITPRSKNDRHDTGKKYEPLFGDDNISGDDTRLLMTAHDHIKASIENYIRTESQFKGHSFMVNTSDSTIIISLLSKNGAAKNFTYDYHIPSDGKIGYEILRIKDSFLKDFNKLTKNSI